jgi:hypothetical protein
VGDKAELLVTRIRQIGTNRLVYGSDAATADNTPKDALKRWNSLPLTQKEFRAATVMSRRTSVIGARQGSGSAKQSGQKLEPSRSANPLLPIQEMVDSGVWSAPC